MAIPKYDANGKLIANIPAQSAVKGKIVSSTPAPATPDYSMYKTDIAGREAALKTQADIYNTQKAAGHMDLANQAHTTANAIRDASGLAGTYNTVTGASLQTNTPPQTVMQPQQSMPQQPLYQDQYARSPENIKAEASRRVQERLQAGRTSAGGALAGAKTAYDYTNQIEGDNRNLRNFAFKNHNDPFSGNTGYQASQMLRNDSIADTQQDSEYNNQVGMINQKLADLEAAAPGQEQQIIDDLQQIERQTGISVAQLQEQQKQNQFSQGMANKQFGLQEGQLTGSYGGQPTLQSQQMTADNTYRDKVLDRNSFESDRSYEIAKAGQEWNQTFQKEQYTDQKAQQLWENTFKTKDFQQSIKDAAASRGLQWATLNQNDKAKLADIAYREKSFNADQTQRGIDNAFRETQANLSAGSQKEIDGLYTGLTSGQITPSAASKELDQRVANGLETKEDAAKMKSFIQTYLEKGSIQGTGPKVQISDNPNIASLSSSELRNVWETDPTGKKAGRAQNDWGMWIKDPKGYSAGLSYELWHDEYGPRM